MSTDFPVSIQTLILLAIPIFLIQISLQIYALIDLSRQESVKGAKWLWVAIIIVGELLGPILYFLIAKRED